LALDIIEIPYLNSGLVRDWGLCFTMHIQFAN